VEGPSRRTGQSVARPKERPGAILSEEIQVMAWQRFDNMVPDLRGIDFNSLSDTRNKIINLFLPQVIPSIEGEAKFDRLMTHDQCVQQRAILPNFTTCGSLPGWLFKQIGLPRLANYGLKGVMDAAVDIGCWVENPVVVNGDYTSDLLPLPGDVFLMCSRNIKEILHIGVIVNPYSDQWWIAEAGQGTREVQQALWDPHTYDPANGFLDMVVPSYAAKKPHRYLLGWVDIDLALQLS
jgi:hypothetical protein